MLSTAMRDRLRTQVERTMPTVITIERFTTASDGEGGTTQTWATVETTIGRIGGADQRLPSEQVEAGQLTGIQQWIIAMPAETDVTISDRIQALGVTYQVVGTQGPMSYEVERRVIAVRVGG